MRPICEFCGCDMDIVPDPETGFSKYVHQTEAEAAACDAVRKVART